MLLATVKGDVHDIGKNIVGVVLGCNNYEVIDLGVMVSCDRILAAAAERKVDIIGLSGLITPSLDEMVFVAKEMERRQITTPLLIGGATTSRQHTAVKIAPQFTGATVHVLDASRAVDVVSSLLSDRQRPGYVATVRAEQEEIRAKYAARPAKVLLSIEAARANRLRTDWDSLETATPWFVGRRVVEPAIEELVPFIDWTFFFSAWELKGRYPAILEDLKQGSRRARAVHARTPRAGHDHPRQAHHRPRRLRLLARQHVGDDIVVYRDDSRKTEIARFPMLRQQEPIADGRPNRSLADFIAPKDSLRAGLRRRVCGHRRPRRRRVREGIRAQARRLQRDHRQGAGGSTGRGVRRVPAQAGA